MIMAPNRPRGRQKNVTGTGKPVKRRDSGLGTGPVGGAGRGEWISGGSANRPASGGHRPTGQHRQNATRSGGVLSKIIILVLVLLLGGGTGLTSLLGGSSTMDESYIPQGNQNQSYEQQVPTIDLEALLGSLGGGSVSTGWP